MKKFSIITSALLISVLLYSQNTNELYRKYIEQYRKEAQAQQKKHGIPASITLAQGLLESAAGKSELATKANNHFGIKCAGGWQGETYRHDDETRQECFRKYKHAEESYEDHSLFLLRPRYKELFDLKVTDYKGWAHGLKKCGYATDPGYAGKLIKIIEDYGLAEFDKPTSKKDKETAASKESPSSTTQETQETQETQAPQKAEPTKINKTEKNNKAPKTTKTPKAHAAVIPPANKEEEVVASQYQVVKMKAVDLNREHQVYKCNGKRFIVAREGDSFESIGLEYNIYESTLRKFNDVVNPKYQLQEGDKIYLQLKKRYADKKYARYRVHKDDNIWKIAQDKGMRMNSIYDLNGIEKGQNVTVNQLLKLRK